MKSTIGANDKLEVGSNQKMTVGAVMSNKISGAQSVSVGANETVRPRTGRLVMFPAWLLHQVRPYRGTAQRISIAFNLSL